MTDMVQTASPALPGNEQLNTALGELFDVFLTHMIADRSQQIALLAVALALCIAESSAIATEVEPSLAADQLLAVTGDVLAREVDAAMARKGFH